LGKRRTPTTRNTICNTVKEENEIKKESWEKEGVLFSSFQNYDPVNGVSSDQSISGRKFILETTSFVRSSGA
jgi:hypothetical protein